MPTDNRLCVFDPTTNDVVDFLRRDESEVEALIRLAPRSLDLIVLPLAEALQRHGNAAERSSAYLAAIVELPNGKRHRACRTSP